MGQQTIAVSYIQKILQGPIRNGLAVDSILDDCGIPLAVLEKPEARIDKDNFTRLVMAIIKQTEDEFLGFAGSSTKAKPGSFNMMSHAVINATDLEQAIRRCVKFYDLFDLQAAAEIDRNDEGLQFRILLDEETVSRPFVIEASIFLFLRFFSWLVGKAVVPKSIQLDYREGESSGDFQRWLPCPALYGQAHNQLTLEHHDTRLPLVQTPISLAEFLQHSLNDMLDDQQVETSLELQIRSIISTEYKEYGNSFPDFASICARLNMTTQTVRRRLRSANTRYQDIKDNIRKEAAIDYLGKAHLSIDEIALLMGFSEASSFHRAFKKWTKQTPAMYRKIIFKA